MKARVRYSGKTAFATVAVQATTHTVGTIETQFDF